ncbi:bacillithiol biosynthesis cysteine-adding enzyme BshC [Bacillus sp. ISL-47]|uniref:bacillithiol biosynthesis cysteine-adding enzyme BshC n=1 Tax=Bacillus sp. ISL-47 TaxID=2819130 RepID=UPI001BE67091|nr:bacillithiol biosynthesis cysteine-adding enzyme BshC [Bacillus sp. ISL-47]MBT2687928.1 bacillithiol biosynthesis cysteine-adding enzyme BshC [Bacillus sp. ISL-47]MBT2708195.1 bacillithiol biosynthesis cysteine-adding enzyme BshC [Pseudomonas sp. ISL-84]
MEILNLSLPATNRFATDYTAQTEELMQFFHYRFNSSSDYKARLGELKDRSFMRNELSEYIGKFMDRFPASAAVHESLAKLKQENSAVIIGGQQAGILTGPLYTIHKIISIISLAEQKEKELGVPVVPVFWIAGEDHDYQEVNHVYVEKTNKMEKVIYPEKVFEKSMVSNICLDRNKCKSWVEAIIESFGETQYTKSLLKTLRDTINQSESFVDFFAGIIMHLFKDTGLLLVDSGDRDLRMLERDILTKQIESFGEITKRVKDQQDQLKRSGFPNTIEIGENAANLFYYDEKHKERILLEYNQEKKVFYGKECFHEFTMDQLMEIAEKYPERLSNNVVTRPITQEWLFPTLAFIAGPGEIAYWAELKKAFECFGMKMPPIMPRLNMTILERSVESDMKELNLDLQEVLTSGTEAKKKDYLELIKNESIEEQFRLTKEQLKQNYILIEELTGKEANALLPMLKKNEELLLKQMDFMESKIQQTIQKKHDVIISKYEKVENALRPGGSPQERVWNGLYYINKYGTSFVNDLLECPFIFDGTHKVIKI